MTHRAQQIVDAIAELVRARVEPSGVHVYTHGRESLSEEQDELPAVSVDYGELSVDMEDPDEHYYDCTLAVMVMCIATNADSATLRESLLVLAVDTQVAINATPDLDLDFVIDTLFAGWAAPEISSQGSRHTGAVVTNWQVKFRMLFDDPGAAGPIPNM